jgi:DNA polymerase-1
VTKLLILDGHSLAYRAFYALPADLATADGTFTNAAYGFTAMFVKVVTDERPDYVVVTFDTPAPTFRKELNPEYKANRAETPETFRSQLPLIREVLATCAVPSFEEPGIEADDLIASLAVGAAAQGIDSVIVTGDRDSYQLVSDPHITVLYNKRGVSDYARYDEAGIFERTGVTPKQYPDYAAMRGDTSDNLPGVPGIGEKTAAKLIQAYNDLEGIYEHLDALPPKQRQNLGEFKDRVFTNRDMMRLRRDVPYPFEITDCRIGAYDPEAVRELFNRLEFRTLLPRFLAAINTVSDSPAVGADGTSATALVDDGTALDVDVDIIRDVDAAVTALDSLRGAPFAVEARWGGTPGRSAIIALALTGEASSAIYVDRSLLKVPAGAAALRGLCAAPGSLVIAHRAKELIHGLREFGVTELPLEYDTALMAYLLDPADGKYVLDALVGRHLGWELTSPDAVEGTLDFEGEATATETGRRAVGVLALSGVLAEALASRELTDLYVNIERPLVAVLAAMEQIGVLIDRPFLDQLRADLAKELATLEATIHELAGEKFLINSVPQLRHVLFDVLGLTPQKKTKTGPSTDADSLQKMIDEHEIVAVLLRYREVEKLRSTYADALPPLIEPDGRVHATLNQLSTTTGRISSENPNLQNVPVRTEEGKALRRAFIAEPGWELLTADYSQIELRVLAHLANDSGLIEAFEHHLDVHTVTAAKVFGLAENEVTSDQRRFAKVVNYGLAYGMEAYGLGQRAGIPTDEAKVILDNYFASFPNVNEYMARTVRDAKANGYTVTLFGRRRQVPELASDNFRIRQMGERMAQNAPVQGSAADIFKLAMINVSDALAAGHMSTRMLMTVHDELVFEVPPDEHDAAAKLVTEVMESAAQLRVPLEVDLGFGPNWADAKP